MIPSFKNLEALLEYTERGFCQEGDIVWLEDEEKEYVYNGEFWNEYVPDEQVVEGDTPQMTLYDLNKMIFSQMSNHESEEDREKDKQIIKEYNEKLHSTHYMFLCSEISYFTIFQNLAGVNDKFEDVVLECIDSLGKIVFIDNESVDNVLEVWVRTNNYGVQCIHLFDYAEGVVTFE